MIRSLAITALPISISLITLLVASLAFLAAFSPFLIAVSLARISTLVLRALGSWYLEGGILVLLRRKRRTGIIILIRLGLELIEIGAVELFPYSGSVIAYLIGVILYS
jgi:hypothetical protein